MISYLNGLKTTSEPSTAEYFWSFSCAEEDFYLRPLELSDVTGDYLRWFSDEEVLRYISSASTMRSIEDVVNYVQHRIDNDNCIFLGLFASSVKLVGTIKFEPIDLLSSSAEVGMLIGNASFRNRGVGRLALSNSIEYVSKHYGLSLFRLGVAKDNHKAIKAYQAVGFKIDDKETDAAFRMSLRVK